MCAYRSRSHRDLGDAHVAGQQVPDACDDHQLGRTSTTKANDSGALHGGFQVGDTQRSMSFEHPEKGDPNHLLTQLMRDRPASPNPQSSYARMRLSGMAAGSKPRNFERQLFRGF